MSLTNRLPSQGQRQSYILTVLALAAMSILLAGCGGGSSTYPPAMTSTITTPQPTVTVSSSSTAATGSADGATIAVPAGSAPSGTTFTVATADPDSLPTPTTQILPVSGTAVTLTSNASSFSSFTGPVYITLQYNPADLSVPSGESLQDALRIAVTQNSGGELAWNTALENENVDTTNDTVTAELPSFANTGNYGIVQVIAPSTPAPAVHAAK